MVGFGSLLSVTDVTILEGTSWSHTSPVKDDCLRVIFGAVVSGGSAGWQPASVAATTTVAATASFAAAIAAATATEARYLAQW